MKDSDMEIEGYFEVNYRISSKLTVNLGLRWEAHPALATRGLLTEGFDFKNAAVVLPKPVSSYVGVAGITQAASAAIALRCSRSSSFDSGFHEPARTRSISSVVTR